ncbi:MAG: hypothetical protein KatS3mg102_1704 [Planctomycetota bacterium]|nr:MAG: hypothetical protein KatS3mg102_1704 [Planctomycetota bacterium]
MPYEDDDILHKQPSDPVSLALLIVTAIALILGIWLSVRQIGWYVNPETRRLTNEFQITPLQLDKQRYPDLRPEERQPGT